MNTSTVHRNEWPESKQYGSSLIDPTQIEILQSVIDLVPESVARENEIAPIGYEYDAIIVAIADHMNFEVLDKLRFILNREIRTAMATTDHIHQTIDRLYQ